MLDKCKLLLNIADSTKDSLLQLLIDQATDEAKAYTNNDDEQALEPAIIQMVCFKYKSLDSLGLNSESYSGVTFNYSSDYPENIKRLLNAHRMVVFK